VISKENAWRRAFEEFPPLLAQAQVYVPENLHVGLTHRAAGSTTPWAALRRGTAQAIRDCASPLQPA